MRQFIMLIAEFGLLLTFMYGALNDWSTRSLLITAVFLLYIAVTTCMNVIIDEIREHSDA